MNEIIGPARDEHGGAYFHNRHELVDRCGNEITADQINALLAKTDTLMAIARAAYACPIMDDPRHEFVTLLKLISAHRREYGPIGGE